MTTSVFQPLVEPARHPAGDEALPEAIIDLGDTPEVGVRRGSHRHPSHGKRPSTARTASTAKKPAKRPSRWPIYALTALLVGLMLTWAGWLGTGGGLFWVGSPSMGEIAPVGSLVATSPIPAGQPLHIGELIVFHSKPGDSTMYIHPIYQILQRSEGYTTKGVLNNLPDPWVITRRDIVGKPVVIVPALGWLYKCATWLFFGIAVLLTMSLFLSGKARRRALVFGQTLIVGFPLLRYKPLIGGYLYNFGRVKEQIVAHIVNTGIVPVHYQLPGGKSVYAAPGQEVTVAAKIGKGNVLAHIRTSAALPWWGWGVVVIFCLGPLFAYQWHAWRVPLEELDETSPGGAEVADGDVDAEIAGEGTGLPPPATLPDVFDEGATAACSPPLLIVTVDGAAPETVGTDLSRFDTTAPTVTIACTVPFAPRETAVKVRVVAPDGTTTTSIEFVDRSSVELPGVDVGLPGVHLVEIEARTGSGPSCQTVEVRQMTPVYVFDVHFGLSVPREVGANAEMQLSVLGPEDVSVVGLGSPPVVGPLEPGSTWELKWTRTGDAFADPPVVRYATYVDGDLTDVDRYGVELHGTVQKFVLGELDTTLTACGVCDESAITDPWTTELARGQAMEDQPYGIVNPVYWTSSVLWQAPDTRLRMWFTR